MNTHDELIDWLRDAYAMERALEISLKKQVENDDLSGAYRAQAQVHLKQTRNHAQALKNCLENLGTDTSAIKTTVGWASGTLAGLGTKFAGDERIKDLLAAYAGEHFEIACYRALQAAAEVSGELSIVALCDAILPDEERMADWLKSNLPIVVREYLASGAVVH